MCASAAGKAGLELGADPAAAVETLVQRALNDLDGTDDRLIAVISGLGIRLHTYLVTRTFELAVHGIDIARAVGIPFALPGEVLDEATWRRESAWQWGTARRCCCH